MKEEQLEDWWWTHIALSVQRGVLRVHARMCYFNDMFKFPGLLLDFSSEEQRGLRDDLGRDEPTIALVHLKRYQITEENN